ncbi:hypothetical protein [Bradyrhizobium sp. ORS 375]|uniref:hypothetical protein n=1 Tax=Bradyrhizobium sp. (strain ORS 375) TaxID=566679 RepID=UPI00111298D1|nr:hypothetical protein [Bradyrhizobium sp. ORS 375]
MFTHADPCITRRLAKALSYRQSTALQCGVIAPSFCQFEQTSEKPQEYGGFCRPLNRWAVLPDSYPSVTQAMRRQFSCIATSALLHRNNLFYVHFNDEVPTKN